MNKTINELLDQIEHLQLSPSDYTTGVIHGIKYTLMKLIKDDTSIDLDTHKKIHQLGLTQKQN